MLTEEGLMSNCKLDVSEDDVSNLLSKLNDLKKPLQDEVISFLYNQKTLRYFKYHIDQYCELYRCVITNLEDPQEYIKFLKGKNTFQQLSQERDEFYCIFLEVLMPTLIKTCYKFREEDNVIEETSTLIQKYVFSYKEFDCYLTDLFENKKCLEKHFFCERSFKSLVSLDSNFKMYNIGFKLFFLSFSKASKNVCRIYKMFIILTEMIGFEVRKEFNLDEIKYSIKEPKLFESVNILNQLLDVIAQLNIDLGCKIRDIPFSHFLQNLLLSVIALAKTGDVCNYQLLFKIIKINPLVVESILTEILTFVMLSDNSNYKKEYQELLIRIFEVFDKLHRMQNLISKMIPTIKCRGISNLSKPVYAYRGPVEVKYENISLGVNNIFPKSVLNYFTSCVINLASWQVINLLKTLLYHLNKALEELEIEEETFYMQMLSNLTCALLLGIRMACHTVTSSALTKLVTSLEELGIILRNFGTTLLQKEHNHVLMRTFLNIAYYWAEVYMTLKYYQGSEMKMLKKEDINFSSSNLTCLHPYLTEKEWSLISERINNFGEKPCKKIMENLMVQKLKAFLTSENYASNTENITKPIILTHSADFDRNSTDIYLTEIVVNNILCKMSFAIVFSLAEHIIENIIDDKTQIIRSSHICRSRLIISGILSVVFQKINKLFKQKRKRSDATVRKAVFSKVISILPTDMFFAKNIEDLLPKISDILTSETNQYIDLKMQECRIQLYLEILCKLPIYFCTENEQKLLILLLISLHKDTKSSSCEQIKKKCENMIINIMQQIRFSLLDICDSTFLLQMMVDNFDKYEYLFSEIVQTVFKSDTAISNFESVNIYIKNNLKEERCLKFAIITLNVLQKVKKNKISAKMKELCLKYKFEICQKMVKLILKNEAKDCLVEPYALLLKTYVAKDENCTLSKLEALLPRYVDYCLPNLSDTNIREILILFNTILQNKSFLCNVPDDLTLKFWGAVNNVIIKNDVLEEFSRLVMLITTLIPNEQFSNVFEDLWKFMEKSISSRDDKKFYEHLRTWSCILNTNFNTFKTNILRERLEFLLKLLVFRLQFEPYKEDLFEEVIQFQVSIIQANHVPLATAVMDFIFLTVSILLRKEPLTSCHNLNLSISLLDNLLKYRSLLIMDRLAPYLLQYRILLKKLCLKTSSNSKFGQNERRQVTNCAHKLEKLTKNLVDCTKDMSRIAMFLIADILAQYEVNTVHPDIKKHLNNCVYSLISLCDQHAEQYLMRVLSKASIEIFKIMYDNYKKFYRFTGKI